MNTIVSYGDTEPRKDGLAQIMDTKRLPDAVRGSSMNAAELREAFLVDGLFALGQIKLVYCDLDRAIIGSAAPAKETLVLGRVPELASDYFAERREIGVLNIGAPGTIQVDEQVFRLEGRDGLYIGRGSRHIEFESESPGDAAAYFLVSFPAHRSLPTRSAPAAEAEAVTLGSSATANRRTIRKYIHPAGVPSCQLTMGLTELAEGSVWNTFPPHLHPRRSEVYLYFDVPDDAVIFHSMGEPRETRHLVVRNRQAVLSPSWSIHAGVGTRRYSFIWAMGGENQEFADMQPVPLTELA